jgi:phosphoadenosine phosphosulfate reductase
MALWTDGNFIDDDWTLVPDGEPVPSDRPVLVSLKRWREEREALSGRNAAIGIVFAPDSVWSDIVPDLARFPVVAVSFPKMMDGRGFSIARLLRDRDNYAGEIRAVGEFIVDMMPLMRRVGIDAFDIASDKVKKALDRGLWPEVPAYYQPIGETPEVPVGTRPWARRPKDGAGR